MMDKSDIREAPDGSYVRVSIPDNHIDLCVVIVSRHLFVRL